MGTTLNWNSTYPATIDDNVTNFPTVNDNVHDVLASHVNELASAVIALENVVGGLRTTVIADPLSPSSGDVLIYNSVSGEWEAGAPSGISFSLQDAYDDGNTISLTAATPVAITTSAVGQDGITVTDGVDTVSILGSAIEVPVGGISDLSFRFNLDTDTGIYRASNNIMAFVAGGNTAADVVYNAVEGNPQFRVEGGTTAAPGFTFRGDPDTGLYLTTVGRIGMTFGGVAGYTFRSSEFWPTGSSTLGRSADPWTTTYTDAIQVGAGLVGSPSVTTFDNTTDTDTGFYWPVANAVAATVGGSEVIRFDGTRATPQTLSAVDGTAAIPAWSWASNNTTGFFLPVNNNIGVTLGNGERFRFATGSFSPIGTKTSGDVSNYWTQFWVESAEGGTTSGPNAAAYDLNATGTNAGAFAIGIRTGLLANVAGTTTDLMSALDEMDAAISAAASSTLQGAYDGGNTISLIAATPVAITTSGVGQDGITVTDGVDTFTFRGDQTLAPSGAAGDPSYSFSADSTVGMFLGTGLEFATAGTSRWRIASNGDLLPVTSTYDIGSAANPVALVYGSRFLTSGSGSAALAVYSFSAGSDFDTGMYRAADNVVGITAGGSQVAAFDGSGATPQLQVVDGSFGNPSLTFIADPDTGFRNSSGTIIVSNGGSDTWSFNTTSGDLISFLGVILNTSGSQTDPAYSFDGDSNTGMYRASADVLRLVTGGGIAITMSNVASQSHRQFRFVNGSAASPGAAWSVDTDTGIFRPVDGWESTGYGISVSGGEVARFENDNAWDDGNLQITKDFISPTAVEQVWQVAAGGPTFVDETTDATNATTADWQIFPSSEVGGDYCAIGMDLPFNALVFDNTGGTAGTSGTVIWEYWNGSAWASLSVLEDGTNGFTAAVGSGQVLRFVEPADWATTSLNSVTKYYIRARVTNTYVVNPVYDQVVAVSQQTGALVTMPDASVITSGEYARMDAYKVQVYGIPGGTVTLRYFAAEYLNQTNVSIQSLGGGGVGMFLPQANAPAYCFLDSTNDVDEGIGYGADTGQQRLLMYVDNKTEGFRVEAAQVFANDGTAGAPGYAFINEDDVGLYRPAANQLGLAAQGEAVIVDNDSATPSFRPDADDVWTLGEAALRWADLFSVTTTVGDLIMHDPDEGEYSPFLILREAHETIEVYDVQSNKKFVIPLQEVQMTPEDQERIDKARAKFYGDK